ncbi:MAG: hypothetical protein JKY26_01665 [Pseudomonas sp.]|nr:hypothetical protein [Pseudomonas sp.]
MLNLHADTLAALKADHKRAVLIKLDYTPNPVYLTNFATDIMYNGATYLSTGQLLKIGEFKQTIDIRVSSTNLTLDAVDPSLVAILRNNPQHGRSVDILLAILNNDYSIAGSPIVMQSMIIDGAPKITNDPLKGVAVINQKISSEFANWKQKQGRRTTPANQHREFPDDTGFDFASDSGTKAPWGHE